MPERGSRRGERTARV